MCLWFKQIIFHGVFANWSAELGKEITNLAHFPVDFCTYVTVLSTILVRGRHEERCSAHRGPITIGPKIRPGQKKPAPLIYAQAWGARREDRTDLQQDVGGVVDQHDQGADADVVDAPGEGEQGERGQVVDDLLLEVLQEQQLSFTSELVSRSETCTLISTGQTI